MSKFTDEEIKLLEQVANEALQDNDEFTMAIVLSRLRLRGKDLKEVREEVGSDVCN
jgi:hypothetical protein